MIRLTQEQIREIADSMDMGSRFFIHKETAEIITYPDELKCPGFDTEPWEEEMNKVEENWPDYMEIDAMESHDAFSIMEDFVEEVLSPGPFKERLIRALNRPKPFRNFNYEIHDSKEYREVWFKFKLAKQMEWVQEQNVHAFGTSAQFEI